MFLGHYAVALAAKKAAPKTSLGTLLLSAQFVDLLWPGLLLAGLEHVRIDPGNTAMTPLDFFDYPISHSLISAFIWSAAFGLIYLLVRRYTIGAWITGLCVLSHWMLDFVVHRPDLPLGFGGDARVGLGLWNSVTGTLIVESLLFLTGIAFYVTSTKARDRIGTYGFWSLIVVLAGIYAGNVAGPPPPDVKIIGIVGNAAWIFILWAYWVDRHRAPASESPGEYPIHGQ